MRQEHSSSESDLEILAQLVRDRERLGPEIDGIYLYRYPRLAPRVEAMDRMVGLLGAARAAGEAGVPPRLGDFRIVRFVAGGGMGEVYEAVQEHLQRRVALKIIRRGRVTEEAR